jgi:putative transposase
VIGSREFVDGVFESARHRFGPKRKDGARKMKGVASPAAGMIWSLRDLQKTT